MRITNINAISALIDRLITENIKLFFFEKDGKKDNAIHQAGVIVYIKEELKVALKEVAEDRYRFKGERRTFDENAIVEELEQLTFNDINIGEADRARLAEVISDDPNLEIMIQGEKLLRKSNEGRSANKNKLDELFS